MTHQEIIAAVESMTVLELASLVKAMEEKFGVSAAAPVAMAAGPAAVAEVVEDEDVGFHRLDARQEGRVVLVPQRVLHFAHHLRAQFLGSLRDLTDPR